DLDIRRPRFGDPLPATMDDHAGAVIFGGPMSANDPDDFVKREIDWIGVPLREEKPFLGICLGAQMLALHLGGTVRPNDRGEAEVGYYSLKPTDAGRQLMTWPGHVYQWHREGFSLPVGSTLLASGDLYPTQAIRHGPAAFGIQFHPELTLAMMHRWTVKGAERFGLPGTQGRDLHFRGRAKYDRPLHQWLHRFLDVWLPAEKQGAATPGRATGGSMPAMAEVAGPDRS
ncbi:MAG: glutamine amidotransferase, partial [Pseudomonadota bacterium]